MCVGCDIVVFGILLGQCISVFSQISMDVLFIGNFFVYDDFNDFLLVQVGCDIFYGNFNVVGFGILEISVGCNIFMEDCVVIISFGVVVLGDSWLGVDIVFQVGVVGVDYQVFFECYLDLVNLVQGGILLVEQLGKVVRIYESELVKWLNECFGFVGDVEQVQVFFVGLFVEQQWIFVCQVYFVEFRVGGCEYNEVGGVCQGSYLCGCNVIVVLFFECDLVGNLISYEGDIVMYGGVGVYIDFGGDIQLFSFGGCQVFGIEGEVLLFIVGIVIQGQGDIQVYLWDSILFGQSCIMIIFGGSILVWLVEGDINVGCGFQIIVVYILLWCIYDVWGNVSLLLQVFSIGVGIVIFNLIFEVVLGDIDLIVLFGIIDVGEVGIWVFGNVNVVVLQVVNVVNIQIQGQFSGILLVVLVNIGVLIFVSVVVSFVIQVVEDVSCQQQVVVWQCMLLVIMVQVFGFGNECLEFLCDGVSCLLGYNLDSVVQVFGVGVFGEQVCS